jgi:hypothetical protein
MAILFDKNPATNWSLRWHQDRVIAVKQRIEVEGFGPWTIKSGLPHVAPPFEILAGMLTLRIHLDPVPATNAPLIVAPGSHRQGRIPESEISSIVQQCGTMACFADAGDTWLYATPILHASEAALEPAHRRVSQVDYAVGDLPGGLAWLGVCRIIRSCEYSSSRFRPIGTSSSCRRAMNRIPSLRRRIAMGVRRIMGLRCIERV